MQPAQGSIFLGLVVLAAGPTFVSAQGPQFVERQVVVRRPVVEVQRETRQQTVYHQRYTTELQETCRPIWVPVTQTTWQPQWRGVLNPFVPAHVVWRPVAVTRWEVRGARSQIPVTRAELVAETRQIDVPVRRLGFEQRTTTERVAVAPPQPTVPLRFGDAATSSRNEQFGGVSRLQSDPPRGGIRIPPAARDTVVR